MSAVDGVEGGVTLDDTLPFCRHLLQAGVDVIDTSSGGVVGDRSSDIYIRRGYAFHAPYSGDIRKQTTGWSQTVGVVVDPRHAEAVLRSGDADIVALGREALADPNWAARAGRELSGAGFDHWHQEARWWLDKRETTLQRLRGSGETPMTRYGGA